MVRAARRSRRVSQRELAEMARVPRSTVDRAEAGQVVPRLPTFMALLGALGYELVAVDRAGTRLELDDEHDALRDGAGRRFPAHLEADRTPGYFEQGRLMRRWWGWERIAWPAGPGQPPEFTYWLRRRPPWKGKYGHLVERPDPQRWWEDAT
jgi:transcriptional regulator with XRE-family HTH domain